MSLKEQGRDDMACLRSHNQGWNLCCEKPSKGACFCLSGWDEAAWLCAESGQREAELLVPACWDKKGSVRAGCRGEAGGRGRLRMLHKEERGWGKVHFYKAASREDRPGSLGRGLPAPRVLLTLQGSKLPWAPLPGKGRARGLLRPELLTGACLMQLPRFPACPAHAPACF